VYADGSSNKAECGARIILEGLGGFILEQALKFRSKATNNPAEYEAILVGLNLAYNMGAHEVTCKSDSQLVVGQIKREFEVKEPMLQSYYNTISNLITRFKKVMVEHICREDNTRVDALSRLARTKKKSHHRSLVQIYLKHSNVGEVECLVIIEVETWMNMIIQYLQLGICKPEEEKTMRQQCVRYTMID